MSQAGTISSGSAPPSSTCQFQAYLNTPQTIAAGGFETVVFNATTENTGSGYDTATGIFTAPETGFYSFQTAIWGDMNVTGSQTELLITYVGSVQTSRLLQITFGSTTIIVASAWSMPMTAGDTIRIQSFGAGTGTYRAYGEALGTSAGSGYSTFSGFLVS